MVIFFEYFKTSISCWRSLFLLNSKVLTCNHPGSPDPVVALETGEIPFFVLLPALGLVLFDGLPRLVTPGAEHALVWTHVCWKYWWITYFDFVCFWEGFCDWNATEVLKQKYGIINTIKNIAFVKFCCYQNFLVVTLKRNSF